MSRKLEHPKAPPLIREKWLNTPKSEKSSAFELFLCCGGETGKMEAVEQTIRIDRDSSSRKRKWQTRAAMEKDWGAAQAEDLIKRIKADPIRSKEDVRDRMNSRT